MDKSKVTTLLQSTLLLFLAALGQVQAADKITFYHYDLLGSPVATTNERGEVTWREEYSPYGEKLLNQDINQDNVRGYTGHVFDEETGLTYMQARYYNPQIGRFMGVDPVSFTEDQPIMFNRYAYGNNNPYKYVDPNGEAGIDVDGDGDEDIDGPGDNDFLNDHLNGDFDPLTIGAPSPRFLGGPSIPLGGVPLGRGGIRPSINPSQQQVAPKGIKTPRGVANQGTDAASMAARTQVENGATLYRVGTTGKSQAAEAQFWSLENPLSKGYAQRYGIPASNVKNANFIETATVKPGTSFVTRPAPGVGSNTGGGIEVVVPQSGVNMRGFHYRGQ